MIPTMLGIAPRPEKWLGLAFYTFYYLAGASGGKSWKTLVQSCIPLPHIRSVFRYSGAQYAAISNTLRAYECKNTPITRGIFAL